MRSVSGPPISWWAQRFNSIIELKLRAAAVQPLNSSTAGAAVQPDSQCLGLALSVGIRSKTLTVYDLWHFKVLHKKLSKITDHRRKKLVVNSVKNSKRLASFGSKPHEFGSLINCWKSLEQSGITVPSGECLWCRHCASGQCEGSLGIFLRQTLDCKTSGAAPPRFCSLGFASLPSENPLRALTLPLSTVYPQHSP